MTNDNLNLSIIKDEQRESIKRRLAAMDSNFIKFANSEIAKNLLACKEFQKSKSLFIYKSFGFEVDTSFIIDIAKKEGKSIYFPRIFGKEMLLAKYNSQSNAEFFEVNKFGILEPLLKYCQDTLPDIDLCITPLLGFDSKMHRLGRGGGYYDRFFAGKNVKKIAIAFSVQQLNCVATDDNDIVLDKIITEQLVFI